MGVEWLILLVLGVNAVFLGLLWQRQGRFGHLSNLDREFDRLDKTLKDELNRVRESSVEGARKDRAELSKRLDQFSGQLGVLTDKNEQRWGQFRESVEKRLQHLQQDNNAKLEQMRSTVDEKLHATLEKRLGESFKLVGDRLELVHKGLGEMQNLASGVGDLKRVLSNVKTRGTWGEIQLENLLEQILAAEQYEKNVKTKQHSSDHVEFAIKMPGKTDDPDSVVWLPIDAKCPQDPYQRLMVAQDAGDKAAMDVEIKQLEMMVKREAKSIRDKYLDPPHTTDFGVMFLPIEGMYAEVLRRPGLHDLLQREYRVLVAGPTTLAALLNSLQMGFRTLAIEKRSSEVWEILAKVKTEFQKFGGLLDKTKKKLQEATNVMDDVSVRTRAIQRNLRGVEMLGEDGAPSETLLPLGEVSVETVGKSLS